MPELFECDILVSTDILTSVRVLVEGLTKGSLFSSCLLFGLHATVLISFLKN